MQQLNAPLDRQDQARLAELSTFFECENPEALLGALRFAHNALCGSPDSGHHLSVVKAAFGAESDKVIPFPHPRAG